MQRIVFHCLQWHLDKSSAFKEVLFDFIEEKIPGCQIKYKSYLNSKQPLGDFDPMAYAHPLDLHIFCQIKPSLSFKSKEYNVVWVPMFNNIVSMSDQDWEAVPKHWGILAYNSHIYKKAVQCGLRTTYIKYMPPVNAKLNPYNDTSHITAFYWNRCGLYTPDNLNAIIEGLNIDQLYLKNTPDPGFEAKILSPLDIDSVKCQIINVPFYEDFNEAKTLNPICHIHLASRPLEGIGISFLEAIAAGSVVVAADMPTMSEYIENGVTGILLNISYDINSQVKTPLGQYALYNPLQINSCEPSCLNSLSGNALKVASDLRKDYLHKQQIVLDFLNSCLRVNHDARQALFFKQKVNYKNVLTLLYQLLHRMPVLHPEHKKLLVKLQSITLEQHISSKKVTLSSGFSLNIDKQCLYTTQLCLGYWPESRDMLFLSSLISGEGTIIDIGANIGLYSCYLLKQASRLQSSTGKKPFPLLVSVEPDHKAYNMLCRNLSGLNIRKDSYSTINTCIGDYNGRTEFMINENSALNSISSKRSPQDHRVLSPICTIDSLYSQSNIQSVALLKIDVEGHEGYVLKGAKNVITKHKPIIFLEISSKNLSEESFAVLADQIHELIDFGGYALFDLPISGNQVVRIRSRLSFSESYNGNFILIHAAHPSFGIHFLRSVLRKAHLEMQTIFKAQNINLSAQDATFMADILGGIWYG
jgi:FkbM family methyltransferase